MKRLFTLVAVVFFAGCNAATGGGGSSSKTYPNIAGAWEIVTANNGAALFANFTQTGGNFFANSASVVYCNAENYGICDYSWGLSGGDASITGTVDPSGNVQFSVSSSSPNGSFSGTLTNVGGVQEMSGTFTANFNGGSSGAWQATEQPNPVTATYRGSWSPLNGNVTMMLQQDATGAISGAASVTGTGCFTSLALSGYAVGGGFFLKDSTNSVEVYGMYQAGMPVPSSSLNWFVEYMIGAGTCKGGSGYGTFTRQ